MPDERRAKRRMAPGRAKRKAAAEAAAPRCPICGKPRDADYRPFCSKRCADVDLGRWLHGSYAIPVTEDDDEDGDAAGASPEGGPLARAGPGLSAASQRNRMLAAAVRAYAMARRTFPVDSASAIPYKPPSAPSRALLISPGSSVGRAAD